MLSRDIERIMKENDGYARMLEEYDRTGKFPLDKIRRSFTLKRMTVNTLRETSRRTGRNMSEILDSLVGSGFGRKTGTMARRAKMS